MANYRKKKHVQRCCNPFKRPAHNASQKKVQKVNISLINAGKNVDGIIALKVTMYICFNCRMRIVKKAKENTRIIDEPMELVLDKQTEPSRTRSTFGSLQQTSTDEDFVPSGESQVSVHESKLQRDVFIEKMNDILEIIGESPIDKRELRTEKYCAETVQRISNAIAAVLKGDKNSEQVPENDQNYIIENLKTKFQESNRMEKYTILTMLPLSWSIRKVRNEFNVQHAMVKRAKNLFESKGFMSSTTEKVNRYQISEAVIDAVQEFYLDEESSKTCPGKRDYVVVNTDGQKIKKQRRLLLFSLNEGYAIFKEKHPHFRIGFSKFASLRPKECTLVTDRKGAHATCVCVHHQNLKLIFNALKTCKLFEQNIESYKQLLKEIICENATDECYLNKCVKCPGTAKLEKALENGFSANLIEELKIKQWITNNGEFRDCHFVMMSSND